LNSSRGFHEKVQLSYLPTLEIHNLVDQMNSKAELVNKIKKAKLKIKKIIRTPRFDAKPDMKGVKENQKLLKGLIHDNEAYQKYEFVPKKIKKIAYFKKLLKE